MLLPFYHAVSDQNPTHIKHLYSPRGVEQFKSDLDYLLKYYEPISLSDVIAINKGEKKLIENSFHITFDDGLSEFYHIAAPILKEKGIPATIFLNSNFIDNQELFYRFKVSLLIEELHATGLINTTLKDIDAINELAAENGINFENYLAKKQPYLSSNQIKELIDQGFTFGAHSQNHPLYSQLSLEEQLAQTKNSINKIATQFNLSYKVFSFPFTDDGVSAAFFNQIKNDVDLTFGCAGIKNDAFPFHLQRLAMETDQNAESILKTEYFYYLLKSFVGKNKIVRH